MKGLNVTSRVIPNHIRLYDSFYPLGEISVISIYYNGAVSHIYYIREVCNPCVNPKIILSIMWPLSYPMAWREGSILDFFCYCCELVVNLYRKNRNPAINLLVGKSQLCTLCYGVTCARPRNRGKTN